MLGVLLLKDLVRARRNPLPYLIHISFPLVITGLLGLVFAGGSRSDGGALRRIRIAVVDEDDSTVTRFLRGALNQGDAAKHLEVQFLARDPALRLVTNSAVAAAVILPRGFTSGYLDGRTPVRLELVKNPAQQFHPAIVEEALAVLTSGLNAVGRNLRPELGAWRDLLAPTNHAGWREISAQVGRTGDRVERIWHRLDPLPVIYDRTDPDAEGGIASAGPAKGAGESSFNLFAFLLPGLTAMFLFFVADTAMRDLGREVRNGTFTRFCTLPSRTFTFVLSKVLFTFVIVTIAAGILVGLGPLLFGFRWERPLVVGVLTLGLGIFAAGLMAALGALLGGERKAGVLTNMAGMFLGFGSGCAFPAESLPPFLREHVTPHLPPYWFIEAMRGAQFGGHAAHPWPVVAAWTAGLGLAFTALAAWRLRRRMVSGDRE